METTVRNLAPRQFSLALRIWHWLDALVVLSLLGTFFLHETLLSNSALRPLFTTKLAEHQINIDAKVARELGTALFDRLWVWHINLGYALTALFIVRVLLFFTEGGNAFGKAFRSFGVVRARRDFRSIQDAGVRSVYVVFYALQLFMILSGLGMVWGDTLGINSDFTTAMGELHEVVMWFFAAFVVAHIGGVVYAELTTDPGLASDMINGGRREPPPGL